MAESLFITRRICNKRTRNVFFYSSNIVLWGVILLPGSLVEHGKVDLAECLQLVSSCFESFVLIQSAQEERLSLRLGLYFAFSHWGFWAPAYSFSFCATRKDAGGWKEKCSLKANLSLFVSEFWMGTTSVSLWKVTSMCFYLLSRKQNPSLCWTCKWKLAQWQKQKKERKICT